MCGTYENDLKKHLLVNLHELLIPLLDVCSLLARIGLVITSGNWIIFMVFTPLNDLFQNRLVDLKREVSGHTESRCEIVLTLGIGTGSDSAASPRSSIMLVMSIDLMATSFAATILVRYR